MGQVPNGIMFTRMLRDGRYSATSAPKIPTADLFS